MKQDLQISSGLDPEVEKRIISYGYSSPRMLPTGEIAAIAPFIFTTGLVVGVDAVGYRIRYCYENFADAFIDLMLWDGENDPEGMWIKAKGRNRDDLNPKFLEEDGISKRRGFSP